MRQSGLRSPSTMFTKKESQNTYRTLPVLVVAMCQLKKNTVGTQDPIQTPTSVLSEHRPKQKGRDKNGEREVR